MPHGLDEFLDATGKAIKLVPDIYNDVAQPSAQETGKAISIIPKAINAALVPIWNWIAESQYKMDETKKLLAKKLEHVGEDEIVSPEAYVAVPALQAISYSMNSEELRNLYANLLSKSMLKSAKDAVHPSFVDIIKQMSPTDANVIKVIMNNIINPIISINSKTISDSSIDVLYNNVTWINSDYHEISVSISNLCRLGLIEIPDLSYSVASNYDYVKNNPKFKELVKISESKIDINKASIDYTYKTIQKTELGISFNNICIVDL